MVIAKCLSVRSLNVLSFTNFFKVTQPPSNSPKPSSPILQALGPWPPSAVLPSASFSSTGAPSVASSAAIDAPLAAAPEPPLVVAAKCSGLRPSESTALSRAWTVGEGHGRAKTSKTKKRSKQRASNGYLVKLVQPKTQEARARPS